MPHIFETSLTNRLLTGALMIKTGGFGVAAASAQYVAGRVIPAPMPGEHMVSPIEYAALMAQDSHDPRLVETAHMIQSAEKISEDLDLVLAERNNTNPVATRKLREAVKEFKHTTRYVEHPNYGSIAQCTVPVGQTNHSAELACSERGILETATGDIVIRDANLFQNQGLKAAMKIHRDFTALNLLRRQAEKIDGVSY